MISGYEGLVTLIMMHSNRPVTLFTYCSRTLDGSQQMFIVNTFWLSSDILCRSSWQYAPAWRRHDVINNDSEIISYDGERLVQGSSFQQIKSHFNLFQDEHRQLNLHHQPCSLTSMRSTLSSFNLLSESHTPSPDSCLSIQLDTIHGSSHALNSKSFI